jgi:hypothetical protein
VNTTHQKALAHELAAAREMMREGRDAEAFVHLERAHVLGQRWIVPHTESHWLMLRIALRRREPAAAVGQCVRMVLGALGSAVGRVPTGNTGGTNISMFRRMPIDPELLRIMEDRAPTAS